MQSSIQHVVIFNLKNSEEQHIRSFMGNSRTILSGIPNVQHFEAVKQVSVKNSFLYGFSMSFADDAAYQSYNAHPAHTAYLENYWFKYVSEFLEIDFKPF
jgi:hypothetical protein